MGNDIVFIATGYVLARIGILIAVGYLVYRVLNRKPARVPIRSQSNYATDRLLASRLGR